MTYLRNNSLVDVARGNVDGLSVVHKFGGNDAVAATATEAVTSNSVSVFPWVGTALVAETILATSSDGNDAAAGTGAQTIYIDGVDTDYVRRTEIITVGGAASTYSYLRINRAYVASCGTFGGNNVGNITLAQSSSTAVLNYIQATHGQTEYGAYTIPTGFKAYLMSYTMTVDATRTADFEMFLRENADDTLTPFSAARSQIHQKGLLDHLHVTYAIPRGPYPAKSDLYWMVTASAGGSIAVSVDFELLLEAV